MSDQLCVAVTSVCFSLNCRDAEAELTSCTIENQYEKAGDIDRQWQDSRKSRGSLAEKCRNETDEDSEHLKVRIETTHVKMYGIIGD